MVAAGKICFCRGIAGESDRRDSGDLAAPAIRHPGLSQPGEEDSVPARRRIFPQFPDIKSGATVSKGEISHHFRRPGFFESCQISCPEHGTRDIPLEYFLQRRDEMVANPIPQRKIRLIAPVLSKGDLVCCHVGGNLLATQWEERPDQTKIDFADAAGGLFFDSGESPEPRPTEEIHQHRLDPVIAVMSEKDTGATSLPGYFR